MEHHDFGLPTVLPLSPPSLLRLFCPCSPRDPLDLVRVEIAYPSAASGDPLVLVRAGPSAPGDPLVLVPVEHARVGPGRACSR